MRICGDSRMGGGKFSGGRVGGVWSVECAWTRSLSKRDSVYSRRRD